VSKDGRVYTFSPCAGTWKLAPREGEGGEAVHRDDVVSPTNHDAPEKTHHALKVRYELTSRFAKTGDLHGSVTLKRRDPERVAKSASDSSPGKGATNCSSWTRETRSYATR